MEAERRPACTGRTAVFFNETDDDDVAEARAICSGCPVRQECYLGAVQRREQHGVWGGVVFPGEWRALMRAKTKAAGGRVDAFTDILDLRLDDHPRSAPA